MTMLHCVKCGYIWERRANNPLKCLDYQSKNWNEGVTSFNDPNQEFYRYLEERMDEGYKTTLFRIFNTANYEEMKKRMLFYVRNYDDE